MADFGLTDTGFVPKTDQDCEAQIVTGLQSAFGASFDVSDGSAAGEVAGIVSAMFAELWEVTEQVAAQSDPDQATGTGLESVNAIRGAIRNGPTASVVTITVTGSPATPVNVPFRVQTVSTAAPFTTTANGTLTAATAWAPSTVYTLGQRVTNASRIYQVLTPGTSAGSGGPTSQLLSITDNTVVWEWVGDGTAFADITMLCDVTGPTVAAARDLTDIRTPLGGVQNATNLTSAIAGRNLETDPDFRVRGEESLAGSGAGTAANIRALLLNLPDVVAAHVFMNLTDVTDSDGVPPHAIEALVEGGDPQAIVDLLGEEVCTGIVTTGTSSGTHVDSEGVSTTVFYSRPGIVNVNIVAAVTVDLSTYTGDPDVVTAIENYGAAEQIIGKDVVPSSAVASALPARANGVKVAGVTGVLKVVDALAYTDTIGAATAWAPTTAYSATAGARSVVSNDGGRKYICITAGTSAGSGGPTGTATDITDGTVHWYFLGADIPISTRQLALFATVTASSVGATP